MKNIYNRRMTSIFTMSLGHSFIAEHDASLDLARGWRSGVDDRIVRLSGRPADMPEDFRREANRIGMAMVTTTEPDNYFMFIKLSFKMKVSPTRRRGLGPASCAYAGIYGLRFRGRSGWSRVQARLGRRFRSPKASSKTRGYCITLHF